MEPDEIYKYLGFFVIVLFLIYIVVNTMKFQLKTVEGMVSGTSSGGVATDRDKVPEAIKSNTTKIEDALLIDKYTKAYEDTIIDLDSHIDMYILDQIVNNAEAISSDPGTDANQTLITKINNAKAFKDSLNHAIKVLDKK
jgi:hypothetical protein